MNNAVSICFHYFHNISLLLKYCLLRRIELYNSSTIDVFFIQLIAALAADCVYSMAAI